MRYACILNHCAVPGPRILLYLPFLLFTFGGIFAQPGGSTPLKKKEQKALTEARAAYDRGNYPLAASLLDELLSKRSDVADLHYLRGLTHRQLGEYEQALASLTAGQTFDPSPSPSLYVETGQLHARLGNFDKRLAIFQRYLDELSPDARPERRKRAEVLVNKARVAARIAENPVPFHAEPLAGGVNTSEHLEYFPSLSANGHFLIFTRRVNGQNEDFYRSNLKPDGNWSEAVPLDGVNSEFNEGAQSVTANGNFLVFTICERPENRGSCDLYYSRRVEDGGWTAARSLGQQINTEADESQPSISADGRLLFFSSNRPGGMGGKDLYVSGLTPDGQWSAPSNLGKTINTPGNEQYPFWAADGTTLFFTSDRHPGLGGEDLFRTKLTPQNTWGEPLNLGYPINTAADETNLFVSLDGSTAYFSKRFIISGTGKTDVDIYAFDLPAPLQPTPATYLAATVVDAATGQPLMVTARVSPLDESAPPASYITGEDGYFLTVLPTGKDYAVTIERKGYLFYSDRFTLTGDLDRPEPFQLTIKLHPVEEAVAANGTETDGSIAFRNVLFETGSARLLPVSGQELDRLANLLRENTRFDVRIAGHTDDVGDDKDNQRLSELRAAAVSRYLTERGISAERIATVGYGERRPVADNDTEEGRTQNRRTTFKLSGR